MFIKNYDQLFPEDLNSIQFNLRKIALKCLEDALEAVKPSSLIKKWVKIQNNSLIIKEDEYNLTNYERICIIGGGKASAEMLFSLKEILVGCSDIEIEGLINVPEGLIINKSNLTEKIRINFASHPIPNEMGLKGVKCMMELVENSTSNDLIICLISGGGSALLPFPKQGMALKELQEVNSLLLASGASIHEINTIRKHLSDFKGGNLAKKVHESSGATLVSLIISDVVGNNLDSIASGPTVPDLTTFAQANDVLRKYSLLEKIPSSARYVLEQGLKEPTLENPKPGNECFKKVHNYLIGSVNSAATKLISSLENQKFKSTYFSDEIIGEAREFGNELYNLLSQNIENETWDKALYQLALIGTGELTVTIRGNGIGGRNQEMLLSFLDNIKDKEIDADFLIIAVNLDGIEGNSKAMGALVDNYAIRMMKKRELDPKEFIDNNDSNSFFKRLESEIITGPTGCNVNDLIIILILEAK